MQDNEHLTDARARTFVAALRSFEQDADLAGLTALFTEDAVLARLDGRGERNAPEAFWREYREQFHALSTTFAHAVETPDRCALEWTTRATLANDRPVDYAGVTVLDFAGDRIAALRTYYDSAALARVPAAAEGEGS